MSKLFDKLKGAAREREGGLLLDALAKAQQRKGGPIAPAEAVEPAQAAPSTRQSSHTPYAGIAVAVVIFAVVILAWHSAPWRAPAKTRIDPAGLKLERSLDLTRTDGAGQSSPRDPARSK